MKSLLLTFNIKLKVRIHSYRGITNLITYLMVMTHLPMNTFYYADTVCSLMGFVAIGSSLLVIGQAVGNPVNAVLWLIVAFVAVACYLITAGMTFLGLSYIIVYVGAIAVLFLFVVMILNLANQPLDDTATGSQSGNKMWPVAILIFVTGALSVLPLSHQVSFVAEMPMAVLDLVNSYLYGANTGIDVFTGNSTDANMFTTMTIEQVSPINQVQVLGLTLYTYGALWLFIISILLILAMLVPLALAFTPLIPQIIGLYGYSLLTVIPLKAYNIIG